MKNNHEVNWAIERAESVWFTCKNKEEFINAIARLLRDTHRKGRNYARGRIKVHLYKKFGSENKLIEQIISLISESVR